MKKKAARRKTASAAPPAVDRELPPYDSEKLFWAMHERAPTTGDGGKGTVAILPKKTVFGIELPVNLEEITLAIGREEAELYARLVSLTDFELPRKEIDALACDMAYTVRKGFVLALLRYADELKHVPEVAAMLEQRQKAAKRGGDARRKEAEPRRQQARRLDRELRKEGGLMKKKTHRIERIAREMKRDTRTIERYLGPNRDKK